MADAITGLNVISGFDSNKSIRLYYSTSAIDVNSDGKMKIEEVMYILQQVSGLR